MLIRNIILLKKIDLKHSLKFMFGNCHNMTVKQKNKSNNSLLNLHPLHRIVISLVTGIIGYFIVPENASSLITIMLTWNVFALCYLILSWIIIIKRPVPEIRKMAKKDDGSAIFVFVLILVSSFASMFTVLLLMLSESSQEAKNSLYVPVAVAGMILSWFMVHSIYTVHYAHMYYDDDEITGKDATGLEFPGNGKPDYIDFAYFAFVIGCTFQVSDVEISSSKIRKVALVHSLLSFGLNTFVVALTINLIGGLSK